MAGFGTGAKLEQVCRGVKQGFASGFRAMSPELWTVGVERFDFCCPPQNSDLGWTDASFILLPMREPTAEDFEKLFPTECHFKVIAVDLLGVHKNLNQCLVDLGFRDHAFQPANKSAHGKYISYETALMVETRARMKEIDAALRAVAGVKLVL